MKENFQTRPTNSRTINLLTKADSYFRRTDTVLAKGLQKISSKTGEDYINSNTKLIFDITASVSLATVATPPILVSAAINKATGIPAFYLHERRATHDEASIKLPKISTMPPDEPNMDSTKTVEGRGKRPEDHPRATRLGRFLRRYNLDELPQLHLAAYEAVKEVVMPGYRRELSLVGARHIANTHYEELLNLGWTEQKRKDWDQTIYRNGPGGLTGFNQVFGDRLKRDELRDTLDKVTVKHASLATDVYLVWATAAGQIFKLYEARQRGGRYTGPTKDKT